MSGIFCDGRVMVVEDDADVREAITEVLEDCDYQPIPAANGQEAIERLRDESVRPCVILLDIMMPVMDGHRFRALQAQDAELGAIPVVLLSANADVEQAASEMQAAGYLRKPVKLEALMETVERFCRQD